MLKQLLLVLLLLLVVVLLLLLLLLLLELLRVFSLHGFFSPCTCACAYRDAAAAARHIFRVPFWRWRHPGQPRRSNQNSCPVVVLRLKEWIVRSDWLT